MYCILVTGIPAAGKSFFAEYLSKYMAIPSISKDSIKEILFDTIGFTSREEKVRLNDISTRMMLYCAEQFMKCGQAFILESNFEESAKKGIYKLLHKYDCKSITVVMKGDYKAVYERFCERNKSPERHPGHVVNDFYPRELKASDYELTSFEKFMNTIQTRGMDTFDIGEPRLCFDTTDISSFDWEQAAKSVNAVVGQKEVD